jgi:Mesyanzhinovviridae DNA primase
MTEPLSPDIDASIDFLTKMYPAGRWVLTAIRPDRKGIETQTFGPANESDCRDWLAKYNGRWNIYWSVNPPLRDLSKKAEREDIKEVAYLHVDVDPRAGEDLAEERVRLKALFSDKLSSTVPTPTAVLFSGGGYQAFWRLEVPIPVNGDLQLAEDAKRYNQQLELIFGGDNCHNIDRIMRLPGTINVPDERKRKKGRVAELAVLVSFTDATYPLSKFTAAPAVQTPDVKGFTGGQTAPKVNVSGNIARIEDINELDKWGVPDRVKVILVQGKHPDEPKEGDNSRSMWVFDACCQLVRSGVPDEVIFSILTDPDYGISESIVEKGGSAEKYAIRQIERAKEEVEEPWLRKLNEMHFVVANHAGDCVVAVFDRENGDGLPQLSYQTFGAFRGRYCNVDIETGTDKKGKVVTTELGKWWLKHKSRREYLGVIFRPGREEVLNGYYNLWQGFGVEAREGDWFLMQKHIRETLAGEQEASAEYILNWAAWALQNPEKPAEAALVFRGGHGVGKGVFARSLVHLFGCHGKQVNAPSQFAGKFNAPFAECLSAVRR